MEPVVEEVSVADEADGHIRRVDSALLRAGEGKPETRRALGAFIKVATDRPRRWWMRRSLFEQFALLSSLVLSLSVAAVGGWVGNRIADGVLRGTSGAAALYMTNFVEPYVQSMDGGGTLSAEDLRGLESVAELLKSRRHVASVKIWARDGTIVYSTQKGLIGKRFPTTDLTPSLQGKIRAGMADLEDDDSEFERSLSMPSMRCSCLSTRTRRKGSSRSQKSTKTPARFSATRQAPSAAHGWWSGRWVSSPSWLCSSSSIEQARPSKATFGHQAAVPGESIAASQERCS